PQVIALLQVTNVVDQPTSRVTPLTLHTTQKHNRVVIRSASSSYAGFHCDFQQPVRLRIFALSSFLRPVHPSAVPCESKPWTHPWSLSSTMSLATLNDIFYSVVERGSDRVMLQRQAIQWVPISAQELYRSVTGVARALRNWGIRRGDRVAVLSEN